jgi:hypothetical protein
MFRYPLRLLTALTVILPAPWQQVASQLTPVLGP